MVATPRMGSGKGHDNDKEAQGKHQIQTPSAIMRTIPCAITTYHAITTAITRLSRDNPCEK